MLAGWLGMIGIVVTCISGSSRTVSLWRRASVERP